MEKYMFGDVVIYTSPKDPNTKKPCVFIRDDSGWAVVMFQHAEWVARVNYLYLSK